jgi:hypothetical protein
MLHRLTPEDRSGAIPIGYAQAYPLAEDQAEPGHALCPCLGLGAQ